MSKTWFVSGLKKGAARVAQAAILSTLAVFAVSAEIVPASDDRYLQEADLVGLDKRMLRIARNEIFARHGYSFNSSDLRSHFSQYT